MVNFLLILGLCILIYYAFLSIGYTILLFASFGDIIRQFQENEETNFVDLINTQALLPVTVIIPCFNEEKRIVNCLDSLFASEYKNFNVILVNDGSSDGMLDLLKEKYQLYEIPNDIKVKIKTAAIRCYYQSRSFPNMLVIDKEHSMAADCLNAALNACRTPLYLTLDADTLVEPQSISRLISAFISKSHSIAVGGAVYVLSENKFKQGKLQENKIPSHFIPGIQAVEYLRSFLFGRAGWNKFGGALCYAGAFTFFETQAVLEVGGYDGGNYAYDSEIIIKLHEYMLRNKYPYAVHYTPGAISWTEVPSKLKTFWNQRNRWQRGLLRSFILHKNMFFNRRYGIVGLYTYPFYFFFEIFGQVVESCSYILFVIAYFYTTIAFEPYIWALFLAVFFAAFLSIASIFLNLITFNKYHNFFDTIRVLFLVFIEMLGFRQYRAFCNLFATIQYVFNRICGRKL